MRIFFNGTVAFGHLAINGAHQNGFSDQSNLDYIGGLHTNPNIDVFKSVPIDRVLHLISNGTNLVKDKYIKLIESELSTNDQYEKAKSILIKAGAADVRKSNLPLLNHNSNQTSSSSGSNNHQSYRLIDLIPGFLQYTRVGDDTKRTELQSLADQIIRTIENDLGSIKQRARGYECSRMAFD